MAKIKVTNPKQIINGGAKKYYFKVKGVGGIKGDKGDKGDTGATGPQGPQGNAATVSIGSTTTLPVGYDATVTNAGSIYNAVLDFGIPQGPQGPQGAKGDKGDTGAQGETGPRGPQGERGTNATVYVGTTSTLAPGSQATVYNSGSDSSAVLNFGIPQGAKGDTGSQGPQGEPGTPGQNFAATVVAELPETGDSSKLYLTPKAHTTQTATGNPVTASVTEQAGKLESFKLDGDTFQQTYTGKNLFNKTNVVNLYNATSGVASNANAKSVIVKCSPSTTYTYSNPDGASMKSDSSIGFYPSEPVVGLAKTGTDANIRQNTGLTFTTPANTEYMLLYFAWGSEGSEEYIQNIQIEAGSTATSFEPYVGGVPSPNPDYPQPIQTVTGEQTVTVIGKNLFNKNAVTNGGYINTNGEVVPWETFGYSEYIRVIGGQTYSYSGTANNVGYSAKAAWYDSNKNFISAFSFGQSGQVTAPATAKFLRTSVRIASPSGLDTYQLELGSTITTYEAYRATNYPISLGSIELCKLGTYQDYIYKDGDDWKVHKANNKTVITDTNARGSFQSSTDTSRLAFGGITPQGTPQGTNAELCDKLERKLNWTADSQGFFMNGATIVARVEHGLVGTTEESFVSWLANNPLTVYYALATPTDTTITDTALIAQLEAIRNAQLETGTSTITNNATGSNLAGDMEIGYYGYNPTNRYDKWIWLDFDNSYEQLNNPETTATLSTRSLGTTTEQTTPTRSVETVTLKKGGAEPIEDKTELPTILDDKTEEAVKEEYDEPVVEDSEIVEEPKEENSEQVESEKEEIKEEKTDSDEPVEERKEKGR